jgi:Fe-Mn family superoxide dismutase
VAGAGGPTGTAQPFTLPPLGYAFDALEPYIDARTMEIHYTKHHQAYINNANKALAEHADWQVKTGEEILHQLDAAPEAIRTTLRNNVGGHVNHSFFWRVIAPGGAREPAGKLRAGLEQAFGSVDAFKAKFADAAAKRFGSGWAWLSVKNGTLTVHSTANQDSPLSEGAQPVLGLDVWEHAYYLHYQNRRADYVNAFWKVVNWDTAAENFARV